MTINGILLDNGYNYKINVNVICYILNLFVLNYNYQILFLEICCIRSLSKFRAEIHQVINEKTLKTTIDLENIKNTKYYILKYVNVNEVF